MKKIMIAVAAIACAVVANAATVNWQSGTIKVAADATGTAGSLSANTGTRLVTAYLFALSAADYTSAQTMNTTTLYNTYIAGAVTPTGTKASSVTGLATVSQTVADAAGMQYGLLIYVDTATAAAYPTVDAFVKSAFATVDVGAAGTFNVTNLALQQTNWTPYAAGAVPEPTSGLLLLLGMAGLALKRKTA